MQKTLLKTGSILVYVGIVLTVAQWLLVILLVLFGTPETGDAQRLLGARTFDVKAPGGFEAGLKTTYPGLILAALGVVLHVTAFLGCRPWRTPEADAQKDVEPA
jgi:hypothetical protein